MNDHVERMVRTWFDRAETADDKESAVTELVSAVHRMLREAENETRLKCEEIAVEAAGEDVGGRVALAIRTASPESLPRKSLIEIRAPDLRS
jgi:ABC-type nitrate/sulfonate/bicarbonate transport system substrate-binding protein